MAKCHRYIIVLSMTALLLGANASARPVLLQVEQGESAFVIDREAGTASWVQAACKRSLPIDTQAGSRLETEVLRDTVELGPRQVELRQRFRFDLATPASVEVYNSVRGGWAPVPVRVDETCHQSAECRARTELPECTPG